MGVWEYGDVGKKLKACERKERQDTKAIFIDSTSVALLFPCCAAQSPREEVVIIKNTCGYCTLLYCNGRMGFVLYRPDDLIPPNRACRIILSYVRCQSRYPGLQKDSINVT